MAKIVNPPAVLESRPDDVDLPLHQLARLPPFSQLKAPPSLDKFPGACKVRFYRAGEDVCVHGDPGWSAYCFVPTADIAAFAEFAGKCLQEGPANREKTAAAAAKADGGCQELSRQLEKEGLPEKDRKELEKKLESAERERDKQLAALALLDEELAKLPQVKRQLDAWLERQRQDAEQAGQWQQQAGADLVRFTEQARSRADAGRTALLNEIAGAAPARQRQLADLFEPAESELARCLHFVAGGADGLRRVAVARLPRLKQAAEDRHGWLHGLRRWLSGQRSQTAKASPTVIPGDGPRDLDYQSRMCSLFDGELIGEISCLNRTPRSATITVVRDCFAVELMRHILDQMQKDAAYKARVESAQRQRLINSALREIAVFSDLPEAELARIAAGMEFHEHPPGALICDEHEEADCLYIIGNGIVKVVTGVSWLLPRDAPVDAAGLAGLAKVAVAVPDKNIVPELNRIIANPRWRDAPAVRAVVAAEKLVPKVWRMLASTAYGDGRGRARCNRLVLTALDKSFPPLKPDAGSEIFAVANFAADWKKLCAQLVTDQKKPDDPSRTVWDRLPAPVQDLLRQGRTAELPPAHKAAVVAAFNALLYDELLLLTPAGSAVAQSNENLAMQLLQVLAEGQLWSDFDEQRWSRCLNRLVLESLCPKALDHIPKPSGLPTILSYRSRNEILGEIGLVLGLPRSATLVTYNHPKNDPKREVGPVQLFRIGKKMIDELQERLPQVRSRLAELAAQRRRADEDRSRQRPRAAGQRPDPALLQSPRAEQLGLVEGQKLMLIDLDRCTRCDECVQACVRTHDDGNSRLFLVGHRQGQYLVPATCRSCLDPVCMIGCPVNSIQRGDNKEILIRDWCIGCERCAEQCPYGSIQMHDTGLVSAAAHDWHFALAPADESWTQPGFNDAAWPTDATPFLDDAFLEQKLARLTSQAPRGALAFRRRFALARADYRQGSRFQIELAAPDEQARVWLNGVELSTEEKRKQGKRRYAFGPAEKFVRPGSNVLAVLVPRPSQATGQTLFTLRLDAERDADNAATEIKLVTSRAVVCDLCSNLPTGPACVTACPHDAAMRINAVASATASPAS